MAGPQQVAQSKSQPEELANPVPNKNAGDQLLEQFLDSPSPQVDKPEEQTQEQVSPEQGNVVNQFFDSGNSNQAQIQAQTPGQSPQQDPLLDKFNIQINQDNFDPNKELKSLIDRGYVSFATTPFEVVKAMENKFGSENVRITERGVEFRESPQHKWGLIDNDGVTNIFDLADHSRIAFEAVIENAGRFGGFIGGAGTGATKGAATGTAIGAPMGPPGMLVGGTTGAIMEGLLGALTGASAAGGTGSAIAINVADAVQEKLLGIERDPKRDATSESAMAFAMGAGFNFLASKTGKKLAQTRLKARQLGETLSNVKERVQNITENVEIVNKLGILKKGQEIKLAPNQMIGDLVPETQQVAKELSTEDGWRNFVKRQGEAIKEAYLGIGQLVGNIRNLDNPDFANKISASIFNMRKVEGRLIGEFRDQAMKKTKGKLYQAPRTIEALQNAMDNFGMRLGDRRFNLTDNETLKKDILNIYPDLAANPEQAGVLVNVLKDFNELVTQSQQGIPLKILDKKYAALRGQLDLLFKSKPGLALASKLLPIKNAIRDDWMEAIGKELGPNSRAAYAQAMKRFKDIAGNMESLSKNILEQDDISRDAFIREIFNKKATSLGQLRAIKTLIKQDKPELWRDLTGDFLRRTLDESTDQFGHVKWSGVRKKINALGDEFKKEIFDPTVTNSEAIDAMLTIGEYFEKSSFKAETAKAKRSLPGKLIRAAIVFFSETLATQKADTTADLINSLGGKDHSLLAYLNSGGAEEIIKMVNKIRRPDLSARLYRSMELAYEKLGPQTQKIMGQTGKASKKVGELAMPAAKTTTRDFGTDLVREKSELPRRRNGN